jgi:hypothetical protein
MRDEVACEVMVPVVHVVMRWWRGINTGVLEVDCLAWMVVFGVWHGVGVSEWVYGWAVGSVLKSLDCPSWACTHYIPRHVESIWRINTTRARLPCSCKPQQTGIY